MRTGLPPLRFIAAALLAASTGWASAGCRIADPTVPEWIEAHGRGQILAISADAEGAFAVGTNRRIYIYPGAFMQPWQERFSQEAVAIAAGGGAVLWIAPDGPLRTGRTNLPVRELPGSRDWHASSVGVGPDGSLYAVANGQAWGIVSDTLSDPICDPGNAVGVAAAGRTTYVWRADGTVVARSGGPGSPCAPVAVPFPVTSVAASGEQVAAVDRQGTVWRRRGGNWQALPRARVYRPDQLPYDTVIRSIAMSPTVLWGRSDEGLAFILSDPT